MSTKSIFIGGPYHGRVDDGYDNPPPFVKFPVKRPFPVVDGVPVESIYPADEYNIIFFDQGIAVYLSNDDKRSIIASLAELYLSNL
jgi:hypothetical protein